MKKRMLYAIALLSVSSFSQQKVRRNEEVKQNKGKMYFSWGWNRGYYSNSDINFKGDDYDFVLKDVNATDRQSDINIDYINPGRVTIPQTNFRIGYFFHNNYTVSFGVDHMKYVMPNNQVVRIDGEIDNGSQFDGVYNNEEINLTEDFLTFEHTDGLNYVNIEVNRFDRLNDLLNFYVNKVDFNVTEGLGFGVLYPKTNTMLMGKPRYDEFHLSGYGISAKVGVNVTFFEHFYLQSDYKVGYINMGDIRTTSNTIDSASQDFTFFQANLMIGFRFQLIKQKEKASN